MRLSVLVDNNTIFDRYLLSEHGVSFYIEADNKNVLLDVGYSDVFLGNAQKMGIDLRKLDAVALSHGHLDHTWGLKHLVKFLQENRYDINNTEKPELITHPALFTSRIIHDLKEIGPDMSPNDLSKIFKIKFSAVPYHITKNLVFLGEIPRVTSFEAQKPMGKIVKNGIEEPDFLLDDTALAYQSDKGLIIITGCSHSGICNIVEYAKKVMNEDRVADIIGGLHLVNPTEAQFKGTLTYLKELNPKIIHACHCTDLRSKIALANVVNLGEAGSGFVFNY